MWQLLTACAEIAFRRRGPESLPDSTFFVALLLGVDVILDLSSESLTGSLDGHDLLVLVTSYAVILAFVFLVLGFFKLERRFRRTVGALLAVDVFANIVYLLVTFPAWIFNLNLTSPFIKGLSLALLIWEVFIGAWVLARSLSQSLIVGVMFEILLILTLLATGELLTPVAG